MIETHENCAPEYCQKPVLVLGCGNTLFGDDGFGPAVIAYLAAKPSLPERACFLDVGSSARKVLFDVALSRRAPEKIIVVDAMDFGGKPGAVSRLDLDAIPANKTDDFSLHQIPTSNLLRELRDLRKVEVAIIVCQPENIPDEVRPGLSEAVQRAIPQAAEAVLKACVI